MHILFILFDHKFSFLSAPTSASVNHNHDKFHLAIKVAAYCSVLYCFTGVSLIIVLAPPCGSPPSFANGPLLTNFARQIIVALSFGVRCASTCYTSDLMFCSRIFTISSNFWILRSAFIWLPMHFFPPRCNPPTQDAHVLCMDCVKYTQHTHGHPKSYRLRCVNPPSMGNWLELCIVIHLHHHPKVPRQHRIPSSLGCPLVVVQ